MGAYVCVCGCVGVYVCQAYKYENHVKLNGSKTKRGAAQAKGRAGNDSFESKDELAHFREQEEPTNVAVMQHCDRLCSATCRLMGTETRGNSGLSNMLRRRVEN